MSTMRKFTYRAGLFDPVHLVCKDRINEALYEFAGVITEENHVQVLEGLINNSHIVELILSGLDDEVPLQDWILNGFPSTAQNFEQSFAYRLLIKLSDFFLFQSSPGDNSDREPENHQIIKLAPELLQSLLAWTNIVTDNTSSLSKPGAKKGHWGKLSQKEMKKSKKAAHRPVVNESAFLITNIPVPQSSSDATTCMQHSLERLKEILKAYLAKIRTEKFCNIIQESFIPQERPVDLHITTSLPTMIVDDPPPPGPTTATATAVAFPMVRPLKSALYFDSPEGFGKWNILISTSAHQDLRRYRHKAKPSFDIIIKKMKELSNGHFSYDNQKRLSGPGTEVPIYEAKLSGDLRLIYQVDCTPGYDVETEMQVLRVYGIYTHAQMDKRLWHSVSSRLDKRGSQYRSRCLQRKKQDGDVFLPICFSSSVEIGEDTSPMIPDLPPDDKNQLHKILTLEKYVTLSKEFLDSVEDDRDVLLPFEVSKYERKIIEHTSSCYVLGRSGTGKTTTMLYKMLRIEREYQIRSEYCAKPRQVFVTQSRVLATKVEDLFASYLESLAIASSRSTKYRKSASESETNDESLEDNEDMELGGNLPRRFSELEDKHFPLFLTVDRLYNMIEADIEASENEVKPEFESFQINSPLSRPLELAAASKGKLVTYDRFLGEYWPHLNQSLRKNITPNLVFNEFMGVIQGSEYTVTSGCLDRKTYEELSVKTQPTFAEHRSVVYGLFEAYRKLKNERWDYDAPDRTHAILRAITQRQGILGQTFDYIYVDETQDNLLVDALVLRLLSRNTDGLFWAGDTAQTISSGSLFRFKDLTSFMFKFEKQRLLLQNTSHSSLMDKSEKRNTPKQFHLAVNYRSHSGIVDCAHSVIELIMEHWPYSIDSLPRERGNTVGIKPIFYQDVYPGYIREGHFLSKGSNRNEKIELGANQCILVRDEAAKQRLEEELGKIGIVITIYDSKGLEFNDVFLYNFFHDSTVDLSQWRLVLNNISNEDRKFEPAPRFDPTRHAAICSELKSLYVAITRARNNLRIADESLKGEPMRALWSNRGQIRNCHPHDDLSDFAVPSSKEEWARRALELSRNHQYSHARDSYEKAGNSRQAAVENARYLQQLAVRIPSNPRNRKREAAFKLAAGAFLSCAESASKSHTKNSHYKSAAQCFEDAGDDLLAAKTYELIPDFTKASLLYRKLGKFDAVHSILVHHAEEVDNMESIRDIVRLYYVNKKEFNKTHQLFETVEDEIEYLEDRNLDMAQVDLYLTHGRRIDAVDIHLKEGRFLEAVDLIIEGVNLDSNTSQQAANYILQGLWQNLSVGTSTTFESKQIKELLTRFEVLDKGAIKATNLLEFDMFQTIFDREFDKLASLAKSLVASGNHDAAFLCLDYHYNILPSLDTMDIYEISASLQLFSEYICTLHNLAFCLDPSSDHRVMKLFGIIKVDNDFMVLSNNFLSRSSSLTLKSRGSESSSRYFSKSDLVSTYHTYTQARLLDRVTRENDICRRSSALNPCLRHLVYSHLGGCNDVTCRLQAHISPDDAWRQSWLSAHLLQISIYNSISGIQYKSQMLSERRFWIGKLHEVLNPPHYLLASTFDTYCDIADAKAKWAIVNDWSRSISSEIGYQWPYTAFLTTVIQTADMAFTLNHTEASTFMFRSQIFISQDTPDVFLTNNAVNILQVLIISMDGKASSSLLMGISFIDHVVNLQIPVDINVFLSFIEDICSSFIICNQYRWRRNLSKVTLPRGWIVRALKKFDPVAAAQQDTLGKFWMLFRPLRAIIQGIHSGSAEYFLYGDDMRKLTLQPPVVRNVFISRVFRVLGLRKHPVIPNVVITDQWNLVGTNIGVANFRAEVYACLTSFRRFNTPPPRIYSSYVNAENFGGIVLATRRSLRGSTFDEMIQILHSADVQYPIYELEDLRRIVYTNIGEILDILDPRSGPRSPPLDNSSTLLGINDPIALNAGPISETREMEGGIPTEAQEEDTLDETASDIADDLDSDLQHQEDIPQIEIPEDLQVGYSDRESSAISTIKQKFTRIVLSRKRLLIGSGLVSTIYKWASLCKPMARQIPLLQYKLRYLAFVPAILGCLEEINTLVMTKKGELKRRFKNETLRHQEMDEISANLTRITVVVKAIKKHQEILSPQSELHSRHDIGDLKKHVQSGLDLLSDLQLPFHLPDEVRKELHMIYKGLLQEPRPCLPTKEIPKKPSLNVDDIFSPNGPNICEWEDEWLDL